MTPHPAVIILGRVSPKTSESGNLVLNFVPNSFEIRPFSTKCRTKCGTKFSRRWPLGQALGAVASLLAFSLVVAQADPTNSAAYPIDLPTALRLAGAQNLDIQIARTRLAEARANRQSALEQFFPWLAP